MFDDIDKMSEEELEKEMQEILAELEAHPESVNWEPPKDMHEKVMKEIRRREDEKARAQLSREDQELLQYGKIYKRQLKHRKYWVLAAALIMALAVGMTSVGGPERLVQMMTRGALGREHGVVNSNDGSVSTTEGWSEEEAYNDIEQRYGFRPVKLDYLPEGVFFEKVQITDGIQGIQVIYMKADKLAIEMFIHPNHVIGSVGVDIEDVLLDEYMVSNGDTKIEVKQYQVVTNGEIRWIASFMQEKTYYEIIAHHNVEQVEFEAILESLVLN